jgi:hypothetical protein
VLVGEQGPAKATDETVDDRLAALALLLDDETDENGIDRGSNSRR